MPTPFRPRLEALDARDLPSVTPFSFATNDGILVTGTFDYADAAVDPAQATQSIPISDLTVALNGQAATLPVQVGAAAAVFASGQFQALSLTGVAAAGTTLAVIDTAGALSPVSVTNPGGQPTPIPPGAITINPGPFTSVAAFNRAVDLLDAYGLRLQNLTAQYIQLETDIKDLRVKAIAARANGRMGDAMGFDALADALVPQLDALARQLQQVYQEYYTLYVLTAHLETHLVFTLPPDQIANMRFMPPLLESPVPLPSPLPPGYI